MRLISTLALWTGYAALAVAAIAIVVIVFLWFIMPMWAGSD